MRLLVQSVRSVMIRPKCYGNTMQVQISRRYGVKRKITHSLPFLIVVTKQKTLPWPLSRDYSQPYFIAAVKGEHSMTLAACHSTELCSSNRSSPYHRPCFSSCCNSLPPQVQVLARTPVVWWYLCWFSCGWGDCLSLGFWFQQVRL